MMAATGGGVPENPGENVAELLRNLNLTEEEGLVAAFSDDEDDGEITVEEWTLVGKVLSPVTVHATMIFHAMKPAWGNPHGLKIRSIGEKEENLFVVEFKNHQDMEWALGSSPWMIGRHALILQHYNEQLRPSEIRFD